MQTSETEDSQSISLVPGVNDPNMKGKQGTVLLGGSNLLNVGIVDVPVAPYIFISVTGSTDWKLNREGLVSYLKKVVTGAEDKEKTVDEWVQFAKENQLMAGVYPLTQPHQWFLGRKRWITMTWQSDWELHLHFGFVSNPREKHTHIQLAKDTKHWLDKLAGEATIWWKIFTPKPTVTGEARLASYETGIEIVPRESFAQTLKSKETATSVAGLCIPCFGYVMKSYQSDAGLRDLMIDLSLAIVVLLTVTLFSAVIRYFFALPRFSWTVAQLRD